MQVRDSLLSRIGRRGGFYACIFCTVNKGQVDFAAKKGGRASWERYAPEIGHTCYLIITDENTGAIEHRRLDLDTGKEVICLSFSGYGSIGVESQRIFDEFQQWKQLPEVEAHPEGEYIKYE